MSSNSDKQNHDMVVKYVSVLIDNSPKEVQPYMKKAVPYLIGLINLFEKSAPFILDLYEKLIKFWKSLEPYKPELLIPCFIGFILCFFGGSFLTIIAAVEAFNMCGSEATIKCFNELYAEFMKASIENAKDDKKDEDNDGVPDVLQVSNTELLSRKTLLFLKVINPDRVSLALTGITAGGMAVLATLKLQFAKTITLGNAIAITIEKPAEKYLLPPILAFTPKEYQKWCKPVMNYSIKGFAVSIAWTVQRVISAFHSAIRGGLMFSRNLIHYLSVMRYIQINHEDTYIDEVVGYVMALVGLFMQLAYGFGLPFPLNLLLLPFTILEYLLISFITK